MTNLKPCPFCNRVADIYENINGFYKPGCETKKCPGAQHAAYGYETQEQAAEAWNTRPESPPLVSQAGSAPSAFEQWWSIRGRLIDPDTEDVSWFDKRKGLAGFAFDAAMAQSRNYVANDAVYPTEFVFANGRRVWITMEGFLNTDRKDVPTTSPDPTPKAPDRPSADGQWETPHPGTGEIQINSSFKEAMSEWFEGFNIPHFRNKDGVREDFKPAYARVKEYLRRSKGTAEPGGQAHE